MNLYRQQRNRQQDKINTFLKNYAFFAFDPAQYRQGLQKFGLAEADAAGRLAPISGGGYLLREHESELTSLLQSFNQERQDAINDPETGLQFSIDMFYTTLIDYEYSYTQDAGEALEALRITPDEIEGSPVLQTALNIAKQKAGGTE